MFSAIVPVAGLGTRSLPASKAIPKELLPVFDRPTLQWVVEEAVQANVKKIVLVTSKGKSAIQNHFGRNRELETFLKKAKKNELLSEVLRVSKMAQYSYAFQNEPLGLGHAIYCGRRNIPIKDSHFFVMLGDDLMTSEIGKDKQPVGVGQLLRAFNSDPRFLKLDAGLILLMQVPDADVSKYGICEVERFDSKAGPLLRVKHAVEKPKLSETSSRWAIVARYLLPRSIFKMLGTQAKGKLSEIQLTDALEQLAAEGRLFGCPIEGLRFDTGDRLGYLKANIHYYLAESGQQREVEECLREFIQK